MFDVDSWHSYVGAAEAEEDGEPFPEKMAARLTAKLNEQFAEDERLEQEIRRNLAGFSHKPYNISTMHH